MIKSEYHEQIDVDHVNLSNGTMETFGQAVILKSYYIEECNLFPSILLYLHASRPILQ